MPLRTRTLRLGLYADAEGLAWTLGLVEDAVRARSARIAGTAVAHTLPGGHVTTAEMYDVLVDQWAWEHPGQDPGTREAVELRVRLVCSLRTWRAVRKTVLRTMCPPSTEPHVCRVPWFA
ncbi:hypothetical protein ACIQUQ_04700 [Streptomyces sp. NPDC101118]|uniref:hypothetical protein n=1 Tax=Streptomyces sp. NPDC101118 TaxID=3366109 RepID=UPI0037F9AA99